MPRFALKMKCFPIYILGNPINVLKPSEEGLPFSKMIDFRGHMPKFTLNTRNCHC